MGGAVYFRGRGKEIIVDESALFVIWLFSLSIAICKQCNESLHARIAESISEGEKSLRAEALPGVSL